MIRLLLTALALSAAAPAGAATSLGVNTHFDQGWPIADYALVAGADARAIRETVTWGKVEKEPGRYSFTEANSGYIDVACRRSVPVLLMILPRNPVYDGARAVFSAGGQRALARYIGALVDRFPCVIGIEVGNEINTPSARWPSQADKPAMYVSMLRAVRAELDTRARHVALVGGSSVGIDVPFHERLFAAGELSVIDGVAVHPYTNTPEVLAGQFVRLRQAMMRHGPARAVWATEFGNYYKTPEAAPPHALKVMTIMSAAGVERAFWYALIDEPWYPNMGLFQGRRPKPALDTFRFAVRNLLAAGTARRLPLGDSNTYIYRFGQGPFVVWGTRRPLRLPPGATAFDARGVRLALPTALGPDPVVIVSPGGLELR